MDERSRLRRLFDAAVEEVHAGRATERSLARNDPGPGPFAVVAAGKAACKTDLQQRLGLPVRDDVPLFGMISRMTDQKGLDLIAEGIDAVLAGDLQLVFLGTGEQRYEQFLRELADRHPEKVSTTIGFDESLAHRIEAGADAYLMPSRYEPCGLNQMYSQRYGTVPLEQFVVSDGNQLWLYDPDLEQVTVQAMGQHVVQTPALLLSGNVDELDDIFQIRLMPGEEDEQQFELTPKQGDSLFEQLRLTFSEGTLVQMHMADSLGQRSSLEFSNTQVNPLLEDSLFQFTPPEGVDVISQ